MMSRIVVEAETTKLESPAPRRRERRRLSIAETICEPIAHAAQDLQMSASAVLTESGTTPLLLSKYRPKSGIHAFTHLARVCNRMNLYWGVHPIWQREQCSTEDMVSTAETHLLRGHHVENGDVIGVVAGTQMSTGSTNFMRLHIVEPLAKSTEKLRKASKKKAR